MTNIRSDGKIELAPQVKNVTEPQNPTYCMHLLYCIGNKKHKISLKHWGGQNSQPDGPRV
jgi:hypothetical protein